MSPENKQNAFDLKLDDDERDALRRVLDVVHNKGSKSTGFWSNLDGRLRRLREAIK